MITLTLLLSLGVLSLVGASTNSEPPVWGPLPTIQAVEDEPQIYDFSNNVSDPDTPFEELTISSGSSFVMSINSLSVTFKFPNGVMQTIVPLSLSDGENEAYVTVNFSVQPVNDPPRWERAVLPKAELDVHYSYNLSATDEDDFFWELTFFDDADFLDISDRGEIAFVPRNEHVGYNYFNVTVSDPDGLYDRMELVLNVVDNQYYIIRYIPPQTAREDEVFTLNLSHYIEPDPTKVKIRGGLTFYDDTPKLDTDPKTGLIVWDAPTYMDAGEFYFKITIVDGSGRYAEQEIRIDVEWNQHPPEIETIERQVLHQDKHYRYQVSCKDVDLEVPGTYEQLLFTNDHIELFTINASTGLIEFTPENHHVGNWTVNITVTDTCGYYDTEAVLFKVRNVNDPPTIQYIPLQNVQEDEPFERQIIAHDPDLEGRLSDPSTQVDPDEHLEFHTDSATVSIDTATGLISYCPTNEDAEVGTIFVRVTVLDAYGVRDTFKLEFRIWSVPDPPEDLRIIGVHPGQKVRTGRTYQLVAFLRDVDTDLEEYNYSWHVNGRQKGQTLEFQWTPDGSYSYNLILVATDPEGARSSVTITVFNDDEDVMPFDDGLSQELVISSFALAIAALMLVAVRILAPTRPEG